METSVTYINTDACESPQFSRSLYEGRQNIAKAEAKFSQAEVTITVLAYNRLPKTMRCVESVLKYTTDIDYELVLIDNGSTDGTLEYFKQVPAKKKRIIRITKNIGGVFPLHCISLSSIGRFWAHLANDLIVTPNWLKNMLICAKSDPQIGMVNPVSSNVSNLQSVPLEYKSYEEMQLKAGEWNQSDSKKWQERLRLITLGVLYKKEALIAIGMPPSDSGFFHDFADDDITFRIRRMGYKAVLAGDTWICHDHNQQRDGDRDQNEFIKSIQIGRANFSEKYSGLDAWDDVNNYYIDVLKNLPMPEKKKNTKILGVDVKCGTPVLDIRNFLRGHGLFETEISAFTQNADYLADLRTICSGNVASDREEFLRDYFMTDYFDYVVVDRPINQYHEPQKLVNDVFSFCKKGGIVLLTLLNMTSFYEFLSMIGQDIANPAIAYQISLDKLLKILELKGNLLFTFEQCFSLIDSDKKYLYSLLPAVLPDSQKQNALHRILTERYVIGVRKK